MASPSGNPSPTPNPPFEIARLFKPAPNPNHPTTVPTPTGIFPGVAPMVPGPYSYPPATPPFHRGPFLHYPNDPHAVHLPNVAFANPNPAPNPNPGPNTGARLMQLLGNTAPTHLESAVSMPPPSSEFSAAPVTPLPAMPSAPPARMLSSKMPRGRILGPGDKAVHDVDSRLPGEAQPPQLEVTPITKYTSDPGLVLGRQIAVNRSYIVYGLKLGNIRVLNINTALRSLLRGHTQDKVSYEQGSSADSAVVVVLEALQVHCSLYDCYITKHFDEIDVVILSHILFTVGVAVSVGEPMDTSEGRIAFAPLTRKKGVSPVAPLVVVLRDQSTEGSSST
ncbi:hypothetical protein GUJ93_ZPchr0006g41779 [Zizania palustris]|uniref:Uncharacterized protein n=1 Tax=Zizania palustris TaxID=103762 RepID=A0A8J5SKC0_ZIZPA|nr:hypothetical protein GUJ93_ZPchr0006g41779 [Zizania palustris]